MIRPQLNRVYEDRTGDRWRVIAVSADRPFGILAQRVDAKKVTNWYTMEGRWSVTWCTEVDLVAECVGVK